MSAYKKIKCDITDKATLLEALNNLGVAYVESEKGQLLQGYRGDTRNISANIIIPRAEVNKAWSGGASNDVGLVYDPHKQMYSLLVSDYDITRGVRERIVQAYAATAVQKAMIENGFEVELDWSAVSDTTPTTINIVGRKLI